MYLQGLTGRGVRVAMVDSGVNPAHPHVGGVAGGVAIGPGGESPLYLDYLGHGTAVAGAIREKAPDAELWAVKVFDRTLSTSLPTLLRALEWCIARGMHIINLSLGAARAGELDPVLRRAAEAGVLVVTPRQLSAALAVDLDWTCPREQYRYREGVFWASGYARPVPGVPADRNLSGASFAVANFTGFAARAREAAPAAGVRARLAAEASQI